MVAVLERDPVARVRERQSMVPPGELLTDTLPSQHLLASGKAVPELRAELRRIPNVRNVGNVLLVWASSFGVIALAVWLDHPPAWVAPFPLLGRGFSLPR